VTGFLVSIDYRSDKNDSTEFPSNGCDFFEARRLPHTFPAPNTAESIDEKIVDYIDSAARVSRQRQPRFDRLHESNNSQP
jgi:hypothetical protein